MKTEDSVPCATRLRYLSLPCAILIQSYRHILCRLWYIVILSSPTRLCLPRYLVHSDFPTIILYTYTVACVLHLYGEVEVSQWSASRLDRLATWKCAPPLIGQRARWAPEPIRTLRRRETFCPCRALTPEFIVALSLYRLSYLKCCWAH